MDKYKVKTDLKLKVQGVVKVFHAGSVINLPEKSAQIFIQQGKIELLPETKQQVISEPQIVDDIFKPFDSNVIDKTPPKETLSYRRYIPTEADHKLNEAIGKPSLNPDSFKCTRCNTLGERYCLGQDTKGKWWWGWFCLRCEPYNEN